MAAILWWWGGSAAVMTVLALLVGFVVTRQLLGVLIDSRGRYSLTHFQLSLWTIVIFSLIAGVFFGRWQHHVGNPLGFTIPAEVVGLAGISVGTAVTATAAKVAKSTTHAESVAASAPGSEWKPSLIQIFLQEEGTYADQVVDITKFQKFLVTVVLAVAYTGLAVHKITTAGVAARVNTLPTISGTFLVLLGISYAGYVAGKLPSPGGSPTGLSVASRDVVARAAGQPAGLRPGGLWRQLKRTGVNLWSGSLTDVPRTDTLVITGPRQFVLHWTTNSTWHDTTAVRFAGATYAVALGPSELAEATEVRFKRRYLDDGWEASSDHSVRLSA